MTTTDTPTRRARRRWATGLLRLDRRRLAAAVLAATATLAAAFALSAVAAHLITRAWTMPAVLDLTVAVVAVRALGISRGVFRWIDRMLTHDVALRGVVELRTGLFTALASRRGDALVRLRHGDLLARIGDDAQELGDHVIRAVVPSLVAVVMGVAVVLTFWPLSPLAAATMLASLLVASVIGPLASSRAARTASTDLVAARSEISARALGVLSDATSLRIQGRLQDLLDALDEAQTGHDRALDRAAMPAAIASATVPATMILAVLGSLLAAGDAWLQGGASAGVIGMLVLLPLSSFEAAQTLPDAAAQLARTDAAAERLAETVIDPITEDSPAPGRDHTVATSPRPGTTGTATVEESVPHLSVRRLSAGWSPEAPCVQGLDLEVPPGSRIAVVGPSGIGKSTLLLTLAGLLDPLAGRVELDGTDVRQIPSDRLRGRITCFAEDAHVFATTVRENLRVARGDASDEEIIAALRAAQLWDWVQGQEGGLDALLGPGGTTISGGERRRLLLARAVLRGAPVSLLDEPTEHLDPERADALLRALLTPGDETLVPANATAIVVTHRRSAIPTGTPVLEIGPDGVVHREGIR